MNYLQSIVTRKRKEVERRRRYSELYAAMAQQAPLSRGSQALQALRRHDAALPKIIAEIKLRSPSAGTLRERRPNEVVRLAQAYEAAGAACVSVLCDSQGFGGTPLDVRRVKDAVGLPVLFKEFVLDGIQLDLAQAMGADLVLLIVASLDQQRLQSLLESTRQRGMEAVVEVFDEQELRRALLAGAQIIGVNSRDLRTFKVDHAQATLVAQAIPGDKLSVFMSGIDTPQAMDQISMMKIDAVLIGEVLVKADDPGQKLADLMRV